MGEGRGREWSRGGMERGGGGESRVVVDRTAEGGCAPRMALSPWFFEAFEGF